MAADKLDAAFAPQETQSESRLRKAKNFTAVERGIATSSMSHRAPLMSAISSYLGVHNPLAKPIDPKTGQVWLFDATADYERTSKARNGVWHAELVAAYFEKATGKEVAAAVSQVAETVGLAKGDKAEATIEHRLRPFFDQIQPARFSFVDIEGVDGPSRKLGPSDRNGISTTQSRWEGDHNDGNVGKLRIAGSVSSCGGAVTYAKEEGWAIISDIDDTIKRTLTSDPIGILKTTFVDEPEAIAGMPEFYKHMSSALEDPPFWYLSASPYNLYPFLRDFREAHYPAGTLLLRNNSWMNFGIAGFLSSVSRGTQAYKVDEMKKVQKRFPRRKLICIGDSTQSDPEAYAEMYHAHPDWIQAIYIRKVEDVTEIRDVITPGDDDKKRNAAERFETAFKKVPRDVWYVFEQPQELYERFDALLAKSS